MNKFSFLMRYGLKKRIWKKSFVITNVLLGLVIMVVINLPLIIGLFQSDTPEQTIEIVIENKTDDLAYPLESTLITTLNRFSFDTVYRLSDQTLDEETFWTQEDATVWVMFEGSLASPHVTLYTQDRSQVAFLQGQIQNVLNDYQGITYAVFDVPARPLEDGQTAPLDPELQSMLEGITSLLFLPIFILIILATQFVGVDIIEEKSSKVIEIVIASVPARSHFLAKILANLAFVLIQAFTLLVFSLAGIGLSRLLGDASESSFSLLGFLSEAIPHWPGVLTISVLFLMVGTLLFLTLAAVIASIATTQEDYQQYQAPLVFLLLGGYYIGIFLPLLGAQSVVKVFAYIPFFSTIIAPIAYLQGLLPLWQTLLSLGVLLFTTVFFLYFVGPLYRVAILSYEETKFFKRIKLYFKKAFKS